MIIYHHLSMSYPQSFLRNVGTAINCPQFKCSLVDPSRGLLTLCLLVLSSGYGQ